jgi:hypothetical protein
MKMLQKEGIKIKNKKIVDFDKKFFKLNKRWVPFFHIVLKNNKL